MRRLFLFLFKHRFSGLNWFGNSIACVGFFFAYPCFSIANGEPPVSLSVNQKAQYLILRKPEQKIHLLLSIANEAIDSSNFSKAMDLANYVEEASQKIKYTRGLADAYNLKGMVFDYQGSMAEAINFYLKALKLREQIGRKADIASSLNNLGSGYYFIQSFGNAETYFSKALAMFKELGDMQSQASASSNLGSVYQQTGKYQSALEMHRNALFLYKSLKRQPGLDISYNNLGVVFSDLLQHDSALYYHRKALQIREKAGDLTQISASLSNLSRLFLNLGKTDSALIIAQKAISIDELLNSKEGMKEDYLALCHIHEKRGNFQEALRFFKKYVAVSDSLVNQDSREKIASYMVQFEFQKQLYEDSIKKAEEKKREGLRAQIQAEEKERQMNIQYSGIVVFLMLVVGSFFLINRIHLPVLWLEGFIFFSALLLFEFLYLFLDPYIDRISGGMPLSKFGINMLLAILIFYAHSFFERLLKTKLLKNNSPDLK